MHKTINIRAGVILEANHLYESRCAEQRLQSAPLCLLVFGKGDDASIDFQRCIELPLNQDERSVEELFQKRSSLIGTVASELSILGVLVLLTNDNMLNAVTSVLQARFNQIYCFFTYSVNSTELCLKCYHNEAGLPEIPFLLSDADNILSIVDRLCENTKQTEIKGSDRQQDFNKVLIDRVDDMIRYCEREYVTDQVLRKLSLLVSLLKKEPTTDIEQALLDKELELEALQVICNQWESAQVINKYT